jgi:NADH-quinone oxidoreductase subunit J
MTELVPPLLFYMFASVLVLSALMVVLSRNPVHSVLYLILAFFNAAGLFLLLGAEFVAFILVIVYVGAVAVLFLFVVMMLDIDFAEMRKGAWKVLPVGLLVGVVLAAQLVLTAFSWQSLPGAANGIINPAGKMEINASGQTTQSAEKPPATVTAQVYNTLDKTQRPAMLSSAPNLAPSNTHAIGSVLYTDFVYPFQVAGLILLVAMIGAITLTLRQRPDTRRQNIGNQMNRTQAETMVIKKVEKGAGIS